jgi:hypothetical protein
MKEKKEKDDEKKEKGHRYSIPKVWNIIPYPSQRTRPAHHGSDPAHLGALRGFSLCPLALHSWSLRFADSFFAPFLIIMEDRLTIKNKPHLINMMLSNLS